MATTTNILLKDFSGHIGKQIVLKQYRGRTIISTYPDMSKRVLSPLQRKNNLTMREAANYAKRILADEQLKNEAQVRLNVTTNRLYAALVREYFAGVKKKGEVVD